MGVVIGDCADRRRSLIMARSSKPILWLPFAAGGLVAALITPALVLVTGVLLPLGFVRLPYDKMVAALHNPSGKIVLFGAIALPAWHAAHRLRMTAHDLGLRAGFVVQAICYGSAIALIVASGIALLVI
jgi:fumarate reductase subunit D